MYVPTTYTIQFVLNMRNCMILASEKFNDYMFENIGFELRKTILKKCDVKSSRTFKFKFSGK